jgi:hypothetical protein
LANSPIGLPIYLQIGFCTPRNASARFYGDLRIAQNAIAITTGSETYNYATDPIYYYGLKKRKDYPTEIGFEIGIGW